MALAGCGGDEEEDAATTPTRTAAPARTETLTGRAEPAPTDREPAATEEDPGEQAETDPAAPPEEQEGGAGDEESARTLALFTARDGRITPRVVRVPAFISVRIELRSADGARYGLRFGGTTLTAGGELSSTSTTIDGLRPGEAIVGRPTSAGNRVRVEATAEPGP